MPISINEKQPAWKNITGASMEDCFKKRFNIHNIPPSALPARLKEILVTYPRYLSLTIDADKLTYNFPILAGPNGIIAPFYSYEGRFFLFEFLSQVADILEDKPD